MNFVSQINPEVLRSGIYSDALYHCAREDLDTEVKFQVLFDEEQGGALRKRYVTHSQLRGALNIARMSHTDLDMLLKNRVQRLRKRGESKAADFWEALRRKVQEYLKHPEKCITEYPVEDITLTFIAAQYMQHFVAICMYRMHTM